MTRAAAELVVELSKHLYDAAAPVLAGHSPEIQGAALGDLTAIWLAGHPPEMRKELLTMHIQAVLDLIPVNAAFLRGER